MLMMKSRRRRRRDVLSVLRAWTVLTTKGRDITTRMWVGEEALFYNPAIPFCNSTVPLFKSCVSQIYKTR